MRFRIIVVWLLLMAAIAVPAAAQEPDKLTVIYENVSLTIDKAFASQVSIVGLPADPKEYGPGFAEPASTQIAFANPAPGFAPESILTIRLYKVSDFAGYPEHERRLAQLKSLLAERPDLGGYMVYPENAVRDVLPFIPVYTHGQILTARAQYMETTSVQGISYVAAFSADVSPFTSRSFIYTVQGLTRDGQYYVSAQAFIDTTLFPDEAPVDDPDAFYARLAQYVNESIATLNGGKADDFSPALNTIDAVVQSITWTPPIG